MEGTFGQAGTQSVGRIEALVPARRIVSRYKKKRRPGERTWLEVFAEYEAEYRTVSYEDDSTDGESQNKPEPKYGKDSYERGNAQNTLEPDLGEDTRERSDLKTAPPDVHSLLKKLGETHAEALLSVLADIPNQKMRAGKWFNECG